MNPFANPMNWVRLGGLVVALIAAVWLFGEWNRGRAALACNAAVAGAPGPERARLLPRCSFKVRAAVQQAEIDADIAGRAEACRKGLIKDSGLATPDRPVALAPWAVPLVCSQPIQDLAADQAARAGEVHGLRGELAQVRANQTAAINRAAARAGATARREADADRAFQNAPDAGDGRRRLDAGGLCQLTGC